MTPSEDTKRRGSILVIDDEPATLKLLSTILTEYGYAVHAESEGELGLQVVKHTLPDLVLVDVRMASMDAYQVCVRLKNDPTTRSIPVVFISSIEHRINQAKALLSGAVDYVTTPFDAEEVLWRIETHMSLRRLRENLEGAVRRRTEQLVTTSEELDRALREIHVLTRVTGRKHAEEKLREQEAELRQVLDLAPQHIIVLGSDGSPLYANQAALAYHGLTLENWGSYDPRRLFHPDDCERMTSGAQIKILGESTHETEARLLRKDGTYHWFLFRRNPLRDGQGHITRWYLSATDIEDRKQVEQRLEHENVALREELDKASMFEEIVGTSPALKAILSRVFKVAPTESTVLVTGETGTGKELIARAIHKLSPRSARAFVSVSCAAIPRDLIASELFGHEKGAFTGAAQLRLGRFELAEGGTIFLDEVGELPAEMQIALLRVLQEREFERVGGAKSIRADVRVIAATNRDLRTAVADGAFRSDLFYRFNVFPLEIPPLRERREDIPLLVEYFIGRYARKAGKRIRGIQRKTMDLLRSYAWPGNIRELQNVIERSVIVCETEDFSVDESWLSRESLERQPPTGPLSRTPVARERELIEAALGESRGRVSGPLGAAAKLGIPSTTLESRIKALKINKHRFKTG